MQNAQIHTQYYIPKRDKRPPFRKKEATLLKVKLYPTTNARKRINQSEPNLNLH